MLDDDELCRVWRQAESIGYPYGTIVRLLILSGQRSGETAALRWEWIGKDTITIPATVTKNGNATTFPIGTMARALIHGIPHLGPLLFPARGHRDKPFVGFGVSKLALDRCGVENFTHHDLRRTFATNLAALGTPIHVTEKLLNHISGTVSGVAADLQPPRLPGRDARRDRRMGKALVRYPLPPQFRRFQRLTAPLNATRGYISGGISGGRNRFRHLAVTTH